MKLKIKKNDMVEVVTGAEKGKRGTVLELDHTNLKVKVQGVKVVTRHDKKEGLVHREAFIDFSNVKLVQAAEAKKKKTSAKSASKSK